MTVQGNQIASDITSVTRGVGGVMATFGATIPGLPGEVIAGIGAAMGLVADLVDLGIHPVEAITRIKSCVPDFDAVKQSLEDYAAGKVDS
jgi:hypothetical protein